MKKKLTISLLILAISACSPTKQSVTEGEGFVSHHSVQHSTPLDQESTADHLVFDTDTEDFWQNLYQDFNLDYHHERKAVRRNIIWFEAHPEYIQQAFLRAQPFLSYIASEIQARKLPLEIILLPIVESAYNPHAYSHAGAAGIWQLMPIAADRFGILNDWWYDGRRDIQDSTNAALQYLEFLQNKFNNDWLLCIAAYNSGEGTVDRAIRRNKQLGLKTDFWSLKLPLATQHYVPRWLALSAAVKELIAQKSQRDPNFFPNMSDNPELTSISLDSQMDLEVVAKLSNLDLKDLTSFNPGFNRWATAPSHRQRLLLPKENAENLLKKMEHLSKEKMVSWDRYKIRSGDTLSTIAQQLHTTTETLRVINHLKNNRIVAGRDLLVPKRHRLG